MIDKKDGHSHYVLIKDFDIFMYNQTLHGDINHFCCYCLHSFSTAQILERHVNDCFEINGKQIIEMAKKVKLLNSKNKREKQNHHS